MDEAGTIFIISGAEADLVLFIGGVVGVMLVVSVVSAWFGIRTNNAMLRAQLGYLKRAETALQELVRVNKGKDTAA
jgi:hypothetical protein